ncbi:MAG TPA: efflux transporter outer membrane subunit [Gemmatimonadales bacterium]|jgi:multidrug efflux system outer membrane protein|nr:efflux transporter outer membrane subunit [Gemmatimonadales bacterium]
MMPRVGVRALALLTLSGCAVGPSTRVSPPPARAQRSPDSLTSPEAARFLDSLTQVRERDTGTVRVLPPRPLSLDSTSDQPWLEVLKDPQVVALVQTAMANNRDLQVAVARVREYRALLGVARGDLFPQLTLNGVASEQQSVFGSFPVQNFNVVRATADLAWELDFWGRLRRQTQAAALDLHGREEEERAAVVSLVSDVVSGYLQLRELDQSLAISEQTLESRRATLALARRRFNEGVISELDVRQFEAEVAAPAARVADFARQRAEKEHQLNVLLGQAPGPIARGQALETVVQAVVVPDSIPAALLLRRPDVKRAERDAQAATARIGLALGNRLPKVMIVGQYGRQDQTLHDLFDKDNEIYTAQVGVSIPLFTGGKLLDQQRAARARAEQARARYEQTVLTALGEADDAIVALKLGRDQLTAQQTQVQALARAYALAGQRYQNGVSSYLEVLDSQRSLFNAQLALVTQERQYLGATVRLYKALGGSWK